MDRDSLAELRAITQLSDKVKQLQEENEMWQKKWEVIQPHLDKLREENERLRIAHNEVIDRNMELEYALDRICGEYQKANTGPYTWYRDGTVESAILDYLAQKQEKPKIHMGMGKREDCPICNPKPTLGEGYIATAEENKRLASELGAKPKLQLCPGCKGAMQCWIKYLDIDFVPHRTVERCEQCLTCEGQGVVNEKGV